MKTLKKFNGLLLAGLGLLTVMYSCQKSGMKSGLDTTNTVSDATLAATQAIQIFSASSTITTTSGTTTTTDAVFAIHAYPPGGKKDSVAFASLPAAIGTYLTANYSGYTFQKAFQVYTPAGVANGYVVVILFNSKPVALKFDTAGAFVAVLEQCEGHDMGRGPGWHEGGRFGDRDGMHHDTVAISALPTAVKAYFTTNYPTDTLLHAALNMDGSYVVISQNKGLFATAVTAAGTLIKRVQIYPHPFRHVAIDASALPAAITTYLTATFPGYVVDKAFVEKLNGVIQEYDVFINVNGTRHAIEFDASGNFVKNIVIR